MDAATGLRPFCICFIYIDNMSINRLTAEQQLSYFRNKIKNLKSLSMTTKISKEEFDSCIVTFEDDKRRLKEIEAKLARRFNLRWRVRHQLLKMDRANLLVEDELVADWYDALANYNAEVLYRAKHSWLATQLNWSRKEFMMFMICFLAAGWVAKMLWDAICLKMK